MQLLKQSTPEVNKKFAYKHSEGQKWSMTQIREIILKTGTE